VRGMFKKFIFPFVISIAVVALSAFIVHADVKDDANKALDKTGEAVKKAGTAVKGGLNKAGDSLEKTVKGKSKKKEK
jgi:hypothetical protein